MEITIAILGFLLHCFTAFALIYSYDEAKIWGDIEEPEQKSLRYFSLENEEMSHITELKTYEVEDYIKNVICSRYHHSLLIREIENYQSNCENSFFSWFFLQLFSLVLSSIIFVGIICSITY